MSESGATRATGAISDAIMTALEFLAQEGVRLTREELGAALLGTAAKLTRGLSKDILLCALAELLIEFAGSTAKAHAHIDGQAAARASVARAEATMGAAVLAGTLAGRGARE